MSKCILCGSDAIISRQDIASRTIYNCRHCGVFVVSDVAEAHVRERSLEVRSFLKRRSLLNASETLLISPGKTNIDRGYLQLTVDQIHDLLPKTFTEQIDMSLKNLELLSEYAGNEVRIDDLMAAPLFFLKTLSFDSLSGIIKDMYDEGFIDIKHYGNSFFPCGIIINSKGWEKLASLKEDFPEHKSIFVCVSKYNKNISGQFLNAVKRVTLEMGLYMSDVTDADDIIGADFMSSIKSAKTVICDVSERASVAYFAAGYAKALGKECLLTCHTAAENKLLIKPYELSVIFWDKQERLYIELSNALNAKL